ncbi:unnamed protein product, partial [Medioppia subpectinata]
FWWVSHRKVSAFIPELITRRTPRALTAAYVITLWTVTHKLLNVRTINCEDKTFHSSLSLMTVEELFLLFAVNPKPTVPFADITRCCIAGKERVISRFQGTERQWGYSGTSDRIGFTVDRPIFVTGFGLYGSIHGPSDYEVTIQIIRTDSGQRLATDDTTFSCDGTAATFRVMFNTPVGIDANTNYTACATLKGSDSHYGTNGSRKVVFDLSRSVGKVVFEFSCAAGCNNGTTVEDGQIPEIMFYT